MRDTAKVAQESRKVFAVHRRCMRHLHPLALCLCCIAALGGCLPFATPPVRTTPTPTGPAPEEAAVLVLIYPATPNSGDWIDVLSEDGEGLARLLPGTWTTLTRPPGQQRFRFVPTGGPSACVGGANAGVGVLDAELVAGRYAHVMVHAYVPTFSTRLSAMCCGAWGESDVWVDLVRVPLLGENRQAALDVMMRGRALEPLPRGMISPLADEVRRLATERESARCFDWERSRIRREDQTRLPMTEQSSF